MKKKLLSLAIAVTVFSQTFASAGQLLDLIGGTPHIYTGSGDVVMSDGCVVANTNSEVRRTSGGVEFTSSVSVTSGSLVDYKASIDMSNVRAAFNDLYSKSSILTGDKKTAFDNSTVEGSFTVVVTYDSELTKPETVTLNLEPDTIFDLGEPGYSVSGSNNVVTVPVSVKAGTTIDEINSDVDAKLADLSVILYGIATSSSTADKEITASMTGSTDIKEQETDPSIRTKYGEINFKSVEDGVAVVSYKSSGGGGNQQSETEPKVTINDDGKVSPVKPIKKGSSWYIDTKELPKTTDDGEAIEGWYFDPGFTQPVKPGADGLSKVPGDDATIYPKPESGEPDEKETEVIIDIDGEETDVDLIDNGDGTYSYNIDDVEAPEKDGFAFDGWYDGAEKIEGDQTVEEGDKIVIRPRYVRTSTPSHLKSDDHTAYVVGYPDGEVKPNRNVTREEVTAIFYRLLDPDYAATIASDTNQFPDVEADRWSNVAISTMAKGGYVVGDNNGNFNPGDAITRAEFAVIASKFAEVEGTMANIFSDIENHWGKSYILKVASQYWINGYEDGTFRPDARITRAEAMTIVNSMLVRYGDHDSDKAKQWPDLSKSDWYYDQVIEATTDHEFTRAANGWEEIWK